MPTGYTADVENGEITTLKEYMYRCARAFGGFVHQREDPLDAELKYPELDIHYEQWAIEREEENLRYWETASDEDIRYRIEENQRKEYEHNKEALKMYEAHNKRYDDMLSKVQAWQPPTDEHQKIKEFAIEQLTISRRSDDFVDKYYRQPILEFESQSTNPINIETLREEHLIDSEKSILTYQKQIKEKKQKHQETLEWIDQFFGSLEEGE